MKVNVAYISPNKGKPAPAQPTGSQKTKKSFWSLMLASVKCRVNMCTHTSQPSASERLILNEKRDVLESTWGPMKLNKCVPACVCVFSLAHINALSILDVCMTIITHMLGNCVDILSWVLRCGLTTHRAAGFWRPAEPGPSQQNPRTEHRNHIHQSPDGHQRGPGRELIPGETITLFTTERQSISFSSICVINLPKRKVSGARLLPLLEIF